MIGCLTQTEDEFLLRGALKCLEVFASDDNFSDFHLPLLCEHIFPVLLALYNSRHDYKIRLGCLKILDSIFSWLSVVKKFSPAPIKDTVQQIMVQWMDIFSGELATSCTYGKSCGIQIFVLKIFFTSVQAFPEYISEYLPAILPCFWESFLNSAKIWEKMSILGDEMDNSGYDSDSGENIDYKSYVCYILELMTAIISHKRFRYLFQDGLLDLCYHAVRLTQLTEDQVNNYFNDPNIFLADDVPDGVGYSVRIYASKLLESVIQFYFPDSISYIQKAVIHLLDEFKTSNQWKILEAVFYATGNSIHDWHKTSQKQVVEDIEFDIYGFLKILNNVIDHESPIVVGRVLWCTSQFLPLVADSSRLPYTFLERAISLIQKDNTPLPTKLFSCKCITSHLTNIQMDDIENVLNPLIPLVCQQASYLYEDSLYELLEVITEWMRISPRAVLENIQMILECLWDAWGNHFNDIFISGIIPECFTIMGKIEGCHVPLQEFLVPRIIDLFTSQLSMTQEELETRINVIPQILDVIGAMVMYSPIQCHKDVMDTLFPMVIQSVLNTQDHNAILSGCSCIIAYIHCFRDTLAKWTRDGETAIQKILRVIERVLDPQMSPSACLFVGPLIGKTVFVLFEFIQDSFEYIVHATLNKLLSTQHTSLKQSLLMVFIRMVVSQSFPVLEYLNYIKLPTGANALEYFISTWIVSHEDFHGSYQLKMSTLGLMTLFHDPKFDHVMVPGDLAIEEGKTKMLTRSQRKNVDQRHLEPLKLRIFKSLVRDHMVEIENISPDQDPESEEDDEEDLVFDEHGNNETVFQTLSDNLDTGHLNPFLDQEYDEEDDEIDPDIKNEPYVQIQLEPHIRQWLGEFKKLHPEHYNNMLSQLHPAEVKHLNQFVK